MMEVNLQTHDLDVLRKAFKLEEEHRRNIREDDLKYKETPSIPTYRPVYCEACGINLDARKPTTFDVRQSQHGKILTLCKCCIDKLDVR